MLVRISDEMALEVLMNRVSYWTDDDTTYNLYKAMYQDWIEGEIEGDSWTNRDFDVMEIVDNDYVNYCYVVSEGDEAYDGIKKLYDEQGLGDISYEDEFNSGYSHLEAEYNGSFLVRW